VLGDPVAPNDAAFRDVLISFLDFCDANAWQVAFHQVGPEQLHAYRAAGLSALKLGEEAVVDLSGWSLSGNSMKGFRSAINRVEREGFGVTVHQPPLSDSVLASLRAVSDAWLSIPGRRERSFTLGRWDDDYVRRCPVLTLESSAGEIVAFINVIADGKPGEGTFDLMRHTPDAPNGSMDVLFVKLAETFRAENLQSFSLGMVPFYDVGSNPDDPLLERGIRLLIDRMERFFSYRGLSAYKDKFHPRWEPRYLIYPSTVVLPQVALAIVRLTEGSE
jgi:phosphatidylglycerol lysyltransferase